MHLPETVNQQILKIKFISFVRIFPAWVSTLCCHTCKINGKGLSRLVKSWITVHHFISPVRLLGTRFEARNCISEPGPHSGASYRDILKQINSISVRYCALVTEIVFFVIPKTDRGRLHLTTSMVLRHYIHKFTYTNSRWSRQVAIVAPVETCSVIYIRVQCHCQRDLKLPVKSAS
jgi:hypothetical protein